MQPQTQISDQKRESNRRNSRRSTGPRTENGKHIASHNALRHGFTGRVNILTPENRAAHDLFCNEIIESFAPETPMERQFAHSIAEDSWRLNGLRAAETNILAEAAAWASNHIEEAVATSRAYLKDAKELQLLSLYEQRINRAISKNMAQLKTLQAERQTARRQALQEAMLLAQLDLARLAALKSPAAQHPAPACEIAIGGFVFSSSEINAAINHNNRLKQARELDLTPPPNAKPHLTRAA